MTLGKAANNWECSMSYILDSAYNGIIAIDNNGRIGLINDSAISFLNLSKDPGGMFIEEVIPDLPLLSILDTGNAEIGHKFLINDRICLANLTPIFRGELIIGAVAVFEDVTLRLEHTLGARYNVKKIIGKSQVINQLRGTITKIGQSDSNILLKGSSGTGKELFARALHFESPRNSGPFIKIDCASMTESLLDQELFGIESGDAGIDSRSQIGKLELANKGTIFLNEIGELPLDLQAKLVKFLQCHCIRRINGKVDVPLDVRVIASTRKNLEDLLRENCFREDLYNSLNVLSFFIPSLRDRREDIEPLVNYFIEKYNLEFGKKVLGVSTEAFDLLTKHTWPGNVRELENVIERAFSVVEDQIIASHHLPLYLRKVLPEQMNYTQGRSLKDILEDTERTVLIETLKNTGGNKVKAARELGISRAGLYQKLEKYKLLDD